MNYTKDLTNLKWSVGTGASGSADIKGNSNFSYDILVFLFAPPSLSAFNT